MLEDCLIWGRKHTHVELGAEVLAGRQSHSKSGAELGQPRQPQRVKHTSSSTSVPTERHASDNVLAEVSLARGRVWTLPLGAPSLESPPLEAQAAWKGCAGLSVSPVSHVGPSQSRQRHCGGLAGSAGGPDAEQAGRRAG